MSKKKNPKNPEMLVPASDLKPGKRYALIIRMGEEAIAVNAYFIKTIPESGALLFTSTRVDKGFRVEKNLFSVIAKDLLVAVPGKAE